MLLSSGKSLGFVISIIFPFLSSTRYVTEGTVIRNSRLYSLCTRSLIISMCSNPKKPHLKPCPSDCELSGSYVKELSFKDSLSRAFFDS